MALFGTDGIRGVAGVDLTADLARRVGAAFGRFISRGSGGAPVILIGKDPRLSSDMLEEALGDGIASAGGECLSAGVLPTPAVSFLVAREGLAGGAMISASHNPVEYNGIKFFSPAGEKLVAAEEEEIEGIYHSLARETAPSPKARCKELSTAREEYVEHLISQFDGPVPKRPPVIALDCAFGATAGVAQEVFERAGLTVLALNDTPDGTKINVNCGSTHPAPLARFVRENAAFCGFAFDGDGDRVIAVDETGALFDGDNAIASLVKRRYSRRAEGPRVAVGTSYSNEGLAVSLGECGYRLLRADTGDRFVYQLLKQCGGVIGGEPSGHLIFAEIARTGDGILSALQILALALREEVSLSDLAKDMRRFPQVMINLEVTPAQRLSYGENAKVQDAIKQAKNSILGRGRVFVRASGTEPLLRILVEAEDADLANSTAKVLAAGIQSLL